MINSPLLPVLYDNSIVESLIGVWTGMINSPLLPLAYDNRSVEHLIGVGGGGLGCLIVLCYPWHMITGE